MDLKAYQPQIRELIALRNSPDFNELLNKILFGESTSDKFLIKMELSRLSQPCQRILDLRDKITTPCQVFEKNNIKHYLTKDTIKVLEDNIKIYGAYTVGVFESVHEHIAETKEKQKIQQTNAVKPVNKDQCELLALSQKNKRTTPRMYFVSEVTLTAADGTVFKGHTSDISSSGVKIKLKEEIELNNDSVLTVLFTGLALEYTDKVLKEAITCYLVKQEHDIENESYLYFDYHNSNAVFTDFLKEFIRLNQFKYKIDVHYYYELARVRALKHCYLKQMATLPICLNAKTSSPFLFALENGVNKQLIQQFDCEQQNQLPVLFSELRLFKLMALMENKQTTTLYTFTHESKGKRYFLSATEEELLEKGLKHLFLNFGRQKSSWHAYHLTLTPFHYQSVNKSAITDPTPEILTSTTHMATLEPLAKDYPFAINSSPNKHDISQLNQFLHRPESHHITPSIFSLFSTERRKEARYLYASRLSISDQKSTFAGTIVDFSPAGLKIKLDKLCLFATASIITVNLSELQKLSSAYNLSNLRYKIVEKSSNNILHLQVHDQTSFDICRSFFPILVKNNAKHFKCLPLKTKKQPIQNRLIEVAEESFLSVVFFLSKEKSRQVITLSAIDMPDHPLQELFSLYSETDHELNSYPIINNNLHERLVVEPFKEANKASLPKETIIYVKVVKDSKDKPVISSFLEEDFSSEQAKLSFIAQSQLSGLFYALHYRVSMVPKIDLLSIKSEMNTISRFAIHLTKKLEESLLAVNGVIEITDRTADIINSVEA